MGMRILRKKLWAHTGFDHPLNSEQFLHKLKKKSVKRVIMFHKIVNVLTKFCDFLENGYYFDRKKNFFVCVILFLTLYLDHLYFLYSLYHFVFSSLVWSLVKKKTILMKKKVLIKTTLRENSAIWRQKKNKFERNLKHENDKSIWGWYY